MSFKSQYYNLNENFDNFDINEDNKKANIQYSVYEKPYDNKSIKKNKPPVNTFPLAWTCYKKDNRWICPMRGDK